MTDRFYKFNCKCGYRTWSVKDTAICPQCGSLNKCYKPKYDPDWLDRLLGRLPKNEGGRVNE